LEQNIGKLPEFPFYLKYPKLENEKAGNLEMPMGADKKPTTKVCSF
jgi:hypothetical protein